MQQSAGRGSLDAEKQAGDVLLSTVPRQQGFKAGEPREVPTLWPETAIWPAEACAILRPNLQAECLLGTQIWLGLAMNRQSIPCFARLFEG